MKILKKADKYFVCVLAAVILLIVQKTIILADTGITGEEEGAYPKNPVHHCTKKNDNSDYTDWSYVYFGSYPQSEVTGDALTSAIIGASYDANGDAWVNGTKYRRISKIDSDYEGNFGDCDYRYFKWERIKWRILKNDGKTLFVMSDRGLDFKRYNEEYTPVTWETSTIRSWISNTFYNTAFSNSEQETMICQNVINNDNPQYETEGGNNTQDKVYLLSIEEVENSEYGFCPKYDCHSASRWMNATDYACLMGVSVSIQSGYEGNCQWWLRSPGQKADYAANVYDYGHVTKGGIFVDLYLSGKYAVVPVIHIDLFSDLWSMTDDGTSGEGGGGGTTQTPEDPSDNQNDNTSSGSTNTANNKLSVGSVFTDEKTKISYLVESVQENLVSVKETADKEIKSISIPSTVTFSGVKYKVTGIGAKAFYNCKKLKKITIPSSVSKIGSQAFGNCKKLKTITVKTIKLTKKNVGKKAFKGIHAKATIKVPKQKLKAYQKLFQSKGAGKKVRYKK